MSPVVDQSGQPDQEEVDRKQQQPTYPLPAGDVKRAYCCEGGAGRSKLALGAGDPTLARRFAEAQRLLWNQRSRCQGQAPQPAYTRQ